MASPDASDLDLVKAAKIGMFSKKNYADQIKTDQGKNTNTGGGGAGLTTNSTRQQFETRNLITGNGGNGNFFITD